MRDFLSSFALNTRGIGRVQYLYRILFGTIPLYAAMLTATDGRDPADTLPVALFFLALISSWGFLSIVKRLTDLQRPWTHAFLAFVPFYNFYFGCQLLFNPGTQAMLKRYGNDPYAY